ncbi:hypothetical protein U1Q18_003394 [Sarracenia purpurea var. burkii]
MLILWIFGFLTWRKELALIDEGQIGSYSVFFVFSGSCSEVFKIEAFRIFSFSGEEDEWVTADYGRDSGVQV